MTLSPDEVALLDSHFQHFRSSETQDVLMERYCDAEQTLKMLGMAVPEEYDVFATPIGWPGMLVEQIESRQDVRALILPDTETADPILADAWDANDMDSEVPLFLWDRYTYGRSFFSVGANEDDPKMPLMRVESPRQMTAKVDVRRRVMTSAAKFYGADRFGIGPTNATLYLPDETIWIERRDGVSRWAEVDRDRHRLGRVPVVMSLCRRRSGSWEGRPLISRVIGFADSLARTMANMAFASEAAGIPRIGAIGMARGDFVDAKGEPLPKWAAYYNAIWATPNKEAKFHQFTAADMGNFETQVTIYGKLASSVTYLPPSYFGMTTANPASEGAIDGEEARLVKFVHRQNSQVGASIGWLAGLWWRIAKGEWIDGSRVGVEWHDPATPTIAQREDALMKRRSAGVLSREGYWDGLGWSEQRKAKEREYLAAESSDPLVLQAVEALSSGAAPRG